MRPHRDPLTDIRASARPQHQVKRVLSVDGQATDLGAVHLQRARDVAGLLAVAVQAQGYQVGGREGDGVPFEHDGCLRGIATADLGRRGLRGAEAVVDAVLEGAECALGGGFFGGVLADGDVDDAAGGDVWREQDGREFNLG